MKSSEKIRAKTRSKVKKKARARADAAKANAKANAKAIARRPPIYGFFHIATILTHKNRWESITNELMGHLKESQLLGNTKLFTKVYLGPEAIEFTNRIRKNIKTVSAGANLRLYEGPTLRELWEKCNETDKEFYVYYFHTKGVSYPPNPKSERWRHLMASAIILDWRKCVAALDSGEVTYGMLRKHTRPRYSGNFWWAKASYIRTLEKPKKRPRSRGYFENWLSPPPKKFKQIPNANTV